MARELVVLVANKIQKLSTKVLQSHMKYVSVACRNKSCMGEVGQILSNMTTLSLYAFLSCTSIC